MRGAHSVHEFGVGAAVLIESDFCTSGRQNAIKWARKILVN